MARTLELVPLKVRKQCGSPLLRSYSCVTQRHGCKRNATAGAHHDAAHTCGGGGYLNDAVEVLLIRIDGGRVADGQVAAGHDAPIARLVELHAVETCPVPERAHAMALCVAQAMHARVSWTQARL
jgi:hypothetical protein